MATKKKRLTKATRLKLAKHLAKRKRQIRDYYHMSGEPKRVLRLVEGVPARKLPPYFVVAQWLVDNELDHDTALYTAGDWAARREPYGEGALFSLTTEGIFNHVINGLVDHPDAVELYQDFGRLLERYGLYWEMGRSWDIHIYPIHPKTYYKTWVQPHLR